ncbi:MAG: dockerin type I repeat-containing protein [Saprospiraceae bacterium]|nr:dockerin type I repeat-containing protein [Saprospiraceae bacterium]
MPIRVIRGYHTVTWSVHDQCGNVSTCIQKIRVKDSKKPTPYMNNVLASSFEGKDHPLKVPARIFNLGSFDNCTNARYLKYSFSPNVNDTIRTIDCTNAGFQYYTIYVTDFEGNQDYAEVYMLAFDNGACSGTLRLSGSIQEANGVPLTNASILLTKPDDQNMQMMSMSNGNGLFNWENIGIYKNMEITPSYELKDQDRLDIADLKMLQDYIMGITQPVNFQFIAADMDEDNRIRIKDLEILKQLIITGQAINPTPWRFSCELDTIEKLADLQKIKKSIILDQYTS